MAFAKGTSGNPRGRPRGVQGKDGALKAMVVARAPEIIENLILLALAGDVSASKLLLDRVLPPLKQIDQPATLPIQGIDTGSMSGVLSVGGSILEAMTTGRLTPEQASRMGGVVELQRRLIETEDLATRIEVLEKAR